jgi:hypothetical protein
MFARAMRAMSSSSSSSSSSVVVSRGKHQLVTVELVSDTM